MVRESKRIGISSLLLMRNKGKKKAQNLCGALAWWYSIKEILYWNNAFKLSLDLMPLVAIKNPLWSMSLA